MPARRIFTLAAVVFLACLAIAMSPLTDSDLGWRNALGNVVWTGMFLSLPIALVAGIAAATRRPHTGTDH